MFVHEAFPGGPSRVIVEGEDDHRSNATACDLCSSKSAAADQLLSGFPTLCIAWSNMIPNVDGSISSTATRANCKIDHEVLFAAVHRTVWMVRMYRLDGTVCYLFGTPF